MSLERDLQRWFDSAGAAVDLGPGSATTARQQAEHRTRIRRVLTATTAVAVLAMGIGLSQRLLANATIPVESVDHADTADLNRDGRKADPAPTTPAPDLDESGGAVSSVPSPAEVPDPPGTDGSSVPDGDEGGRVTPDDLTYLGAFMAPAGEYGGSQFGFGGAAAAFYPEGDPGGDDGFNGSLFLSGSPVQDPGVAEISIPEPKRHDGTTTGLPIARVLQPFADLTAGRGAEIVGGGAAGGLGFRYSGLEVVEGPGGPRLHWTIWKYHNVVPSIVPGHGHSSLDLSALDPQGPWFLGEYDSRATAGYLFSAPQEFADAHLGGRRLITGLQDEEASGQTSWGPPFFAFDPPPSAEPGSRLDVLPLAFYDRTHALDGFGQADTAAGAEWVTTSDGAEAVVTVGRRGLGEVRNGEAESEDCGSGIGVHAGPYEPLVMFYDPEDLARVASGDLEAWELEPYLTWNPAEYLIPTCDGFLTSISFDERSGRLYVVQPDADTSQNGDAPVPVIHVFQI